MDTSSSFNRARILYRQQPRARKPIAVVPIIFWLLVLSFGAIFCVWTRSRVLDEHQKIAELKKEILELELRNYELRGEIARLESPARLEQLGNQLGLVYPELGQVISLRALKKEEEKQISLAQP